MRIFFKQKCEALVGGVDQACIDGTRLHLGADGYGIVVKGLTQKGQNSVSNLIEVVLLQLVFKAYPHNRFVF